MRAIPGFDTIEELEAWAAEVNGITVEQYQAGIIDEWERAASAPRKGYYKAPIPQDVRSRIFCRDLHQCQYCGARNLPLCVDHVHPERHGGELEDSNLLTACRPCNLSKGSKQGAIFEAWRRKRKKIWGEIK